MDYGNHKDIDKYDVVEWMIRTDVNIPMNKKWTAWIKTLTGSGKLDDYGLFIELFQCIQVRSMSEAMAGTVGSLMNINSGTGRQLQPVTFSVESYLRFNLSPLHALGGLVKDVAEIHGNH